MKYLKIILFFVFAVSFDFCYGEENGLDSTSVNASKDSLNYGKSVGVFGGSFSVISNSNIEKDKWLKYLGMYVTDYGISGYGFSSLQGSIQNKVDKCGYEDIYVLWASTNDIRAGRYCGKETDYTKVDTFDIKHLETQCGGINYCIKRLREINPHCKIYFISTFQFFSDKFGYDTVSVNRLNERTVDYVNAQEACCKAQGVKFLNLFSLNLFNPDNYIDYYSPDKLHPNKAGYKLISKYIFLFLSDNWIKSSTFSENDRRKRIMKKSNIRCRKFSYTL